MDNFETGNDVTPFAMGGKPPQDAASPFHMTAPPVLSAMAVVSLLFGLISPVLLCVCGLSLLSSLVAIVTGHISLVKINNSEGQLTGRGMAIGGLISGYLMLGITVVAIIVFLPGFRNDWRPEPGDYAQTSSSDSPDASRRLMQAEKNVTIAGEQGVATGNSPKAIELAEDFAELMKSMRDTLFTKDDSLTGAITAGHFVTHCELHDGRYAFIVHVPAYNKFDGDAKDSLASIAWRVAQGTVEGQLAPGDQLAVGLRGRLIYGAVLIGQVGLEDEDSGFEDRDRDALLPFFPLTFDQPRTASLPSESPANAPTAEGDARPADDIADIPLPDWTPPAASVPPRQSATIPAPKSPSPEPIAKPSRPAAEPTPTNRAPAPKNPAPVPTKPRRTVTSRPSLMDNVPVSREVVQQFPEMGWTVEALAFSPDGRWLAAGKLDRTLLILDIATGKTLSSATKLHELSGLQEVGFSPDGQSVAAAGSTGAVIAWPINDVGDLGDARPLTRHGQRVQSLTISPTAPFLVTGAANGELIWQSYMSSTSTSRKLKALPRGALAIYLPEVGVEALATDGSNLVRVDLKSARVIGTREFPRGGAQAAAFSSDGTKLAITAGYNIQIWDTASGESLNTLEGDHEMQWSVAFLPDGKRLISGGRGFATLWNLEDGQALRRFDLGGIQYIQTFAISADATMLAAIPASAGQTLSVLRIPQ